MTEQQIHTHFLDNGLTLIVERMKDVQSAAFALLVPAGSIYDPEGQNGSGSLLCDWITRGAGQLDSKQLSAALDNLGVQRHESIGHSHLTLSGATVADNIPAALELTADVVRRPHLPDDQFDAARSGLLQTLQALEDEPRPKTMIELRRLTYPSPWGRPTEGTLSEVPGLSADSVRQHYQNCFGPDGAILGIAGNVDATQIRETVERLFGDWQSPARPAVQSGPRGARQDHLDHESTQTHIGIAYDAVPYRHPDYYAAWAAASVLSGGMSARLFTEIRERRGLCYAISASLNSLKDEGRVLCYAGTTADRAQETLDVTLEELARLGDGIGPEELERCQARAKSSLIMQQESTMSRAASVARDWFHLGRVTTLEEVRAKIEGLTAETVLDYVHQHPARDFTVLTIGPQPLEVPREVS